MPKGPLRYLCDPDVRECLHDGPNMIGIRLYLERQAQQSYLLPAETPTNDGKLP